MPKRNCTPQRAALALGVTASSGPLRRRPHCVCYCLFGAFLLAATLGAARTGHRRAMPCAPTSCPRRGLSNGTTPADFPALRLLLFAVFFMSYTLAPYHGWGGLLGRSCPVLHVSADVSSPAVYAPTRATRTFAPTVAHAPDFRVHFGPHSSPVLAVRWLDGYLAGFYYFTGDVA